MALAVNIADRRSALKAALMRPRPALDRLPRLNELLREACESVGSAIEPIAPNMRASLIGIEPGRCQDHLGRDWQSQLCAVLTTGDGTGEILLHFAPHTISQFTGLALGGQGPVNVTTWPKSSLSRIELAIARSLAEAVTRVLSDAFRNADIDIRLIVGSVDTDQSATASARENVPAFAARIAMDAALTAPWLTLLIPQSLVAPHAVKLGREPQRRTAGQAATGDASWRRKVESELSRANINVAAVLETRPASLADLADLKVGHILALDATAQSRVILESEDVPLFSCELGKQNGILTVRVESRLQSGDQKTAPGVAAAALSAAPS